MGACDVGLVEADHPVDAEFVQEAARFDTLWLLGYRHLGLAALRQVVEDRRQPGLVRAAGIDLIADPASLDELDLAILPN